jgi:hypothetical protein
MCEIKTATTVKRGKINKKTHKTLHKKYRFFGTDLWGTLGRSFRDNGIVQKIAKITYKTIMGQLKTEDEQNDEAKKILNRFPEAYKQKYSGEFTYNVAEESDERMSSHGNKPYSAGGASRILRKKLTLFYGGGRMRLPTFKIYSKFTDIRNREDQLTVLRRRLGTTRNYITKLETRADIFFFRIGFFGSIYESRNFCYLKRARVKNYSKYLMPWHRIQALEICFVTYYRQLQKLFILNLLKKRILVPAWISLSIMYMCAFVLYYPPRVGYPGRDMSGASLKVFRIGF